jgi:sec-independent protein translocase protein TatC
MRILPRRRAKKEFARAADGSMTLMEHFQELRSRLFKASLAIVAGLCVGLFIAQPTLDFINQPYCDLVPKNECQFTLNGPVDAFLLELRVALYVGLVLSAPIWLYQLWAFVAPGLHRNERKFAYIFAGVATPLFAAGVVLARLIVGKTMHFFLGSAGTGDKFSLVVNLTGYFDFVTGMMLLFGAAFEFPLLIAMLNLAGVVSAKKLLSWWRIAVFLMFVFAAVVTPTPDPFAMSILAVCMSLLYFAAVGFAFLNDRRRARSNPYAELDDDEVSPLADDLDDLDGTEAVAADGSAMRASALDLVEPVEGAKPVTAPLPIERRYDDVT